MVARRNTVKELRGPQGKRGHMGPKGPTGRPGKSGKRGATGARGRTGDMGGRGPIGKAGKIGPEGLKGPLHKDAVLDMVMTHFEDVFDQIKVQTRRMSQMQAEIDLLAARVRQLEKH